MNTFLRSFAAKLAFRRGPAYLTTNGAIACILQQGATARRQVQSMHRVTVPAPSLISTGAAAASMVDHP